MNRLALATCVTAFLLSACGGGGDPSAGPGPGPAPGGLTIESSTPAQGATGVARDVQPQLTLSAAVDPATVVLSNAAGPANAAVTAQGTQVNVAPGQQLLPGTTYEVKVANGPTLTFTTRDGVWSATPSRLNTSLADAEEPHVAVDARGNATAVWYQWDGAMRNIWAARYERGTGWSAPFNLEQDAAYADSPQVAMDAEGNAIAVWIQAHVSAPSLWASRFTPAGGWETPELLENMDGSAAIEPRIAMNAAGHAVVAWYQNEATQNIYANRYVPGTGWTGAQSIDAHPQPAFVPRVAITPAGLAVVAWTQRNAAFQRDLAASTAPAGGAWSTPVLVEQGSGDVDDVDLAAGAGGSVVAAWRQADGTTQCRAAYLRNDGTWAASQRVDSQVAACQDPRVAVDARGGAHVVWAQTSGAESAIWSNASTPDGSWGTATQVSTGVGEAIEPVIAVDAVGNALAVWRQDSGTGDSPAHASRRLAGSTWSAPRLLEPASGHSVQFGPVVAMDASGNALALWSEWDMAAAKVNAVASRFD